MRIKIDKPVVPYKLSRELIAAGVEISHNVAILPKNGLEIPLVDETQRDELLPIIETVIDAHDSIDDIANLQADAKERMRNIPGWATTTEAQALEWFNAHIEILAIPADIKTLLRAYGQMLIALRDKVWPEL